MQCDFHACKLQCRTVLEKWQLIFVYKALFVLIVAIVAVRMLRCQQMYIIEIHALPEHLQQISMSPANQLGSDNATTTTTTTVPTYHFQTLNQQNQLDLHLMVTRIPGASVHSKHLQWSLGPWSPCNNRFLVQVQLVQSV